ncbi:MAG: hypothetical protein NC390_04620 [Fusobacterium sp.]|nr:hypothetical protein [Fusobacterium sp.]
MGYVRRRNPWPCRRFRRFRPFLDKAPLFDDFSNGAAVQTPTKVQTNAQIKLEQIKANVEKQNILPTLKDYVANIESVSEFNFLNTMLRNKKQKDISYLNLLTTPEDKALFSDLMKIAQQDPLFNPIDSVKFYALRKNNPQVKQRYLNMLELVKNGTLDAGMLQTYAAGGSDLRITNDINLLLKAKQENLSIQQVKDLYIPKIETLTLKNLEIIQAGNVFEHNGKLLMKISDKQVQPLRISKDTYFELFQPAYYVKQQAAGKCYLYSTILTGLENPIAKAKMLNECFSEANGVLNVHLPNSKVSIDVNLNNIDAAIQNSSYYSRGSKGVNLLEQAYEKNEVYLQSQKMIEFLNKKISEPNSNIDLEKAMEILDDLTQNPANPHYVLNNINSIENNTQFSLDDIIHIDAAKKQNSVKGMLANPENLETADLFYGVFEGNTGYASRAFNFGQNPMGNVGYAKMVLTHPQNGQHLITDDLLSRCQNLLMTAATGKKGPQVESVLNADFGILSSHAYACSLKNINGKPMMKLLNPHNSSSPIFLNLEQFRKYFYSVTINNVL